MKTTLIGLFFLTCFVSTEAQDYYKPDTVQHNSTPTVYLGPGIGINNYTGLIGIGADIRIHNTLFIRAGLGIGTWGTKVTIGMKYAQGYSSGWVFSLFYSHCSGLTDFSTQLETDTGGGTITKNVNMDLLPASSINFTASYAWVFHKKDNFFLEFGYAIPLQSNPYVVNDHSVLTPVSKESVNIMAPGGLVLDIGLMFGL